MVPPSSRKVPRVSRYFGSCRRCRDSRTGLSPSAVGFPKTVLLSLHHTLCSPKPRMVSQPVWALSISLAATLEIDVSFSSSGYLDVSVHRVPFHTLCIGVWMTGVFPAGFPHSDISGSLLICSSPKLFAAYHVFHRLLVPRHPPCALSSLTFHRRNLPLGLFLLC